MCVCVCVYVYVCVSALLRCLKQYVFLPFRGEIVLFVLVLNAPLPEEERACCWWPDPSLVFLQSQGPRTEYKHIQTGEGVLL